MIRFPAILLAMAACLALAGGTPAVAKTPMPGLKSTPAGTLGQQPAKATPGVHQSGTGALPRTGISVALEVLLAAALLGAGTVLRTSRTPGRA